MKKSKFSILLKIFLAGTLITVSSHLALADAPAGCISSQSVGHGITAPHLKTSTPAPYGFLEYLPDGYSATGPTFPVIIHLHGANEKGIETNATELERKMALNGPFRRIAEGREFPALVFAPQSDWWFNPQQLDEFIDFLIANYRVDKTRIYLTGLSMGGGGVWDYMRYDPERLAAAIANCGAPVQEIRLSDGDALRRVPHLAIHAKNDDTVGVDGTYRAGNALGFALGAINQVQSGDISGHDVTTYFDLATRQWVTLDGNRKYRDASGNFLNSPYIYAFPAYEGHGTWGNTYADEDTWDWLFCQSKSGNNPPTTPPSGNAIKIEAENYSQMFGVGVEPTTDVGGGNNVGWLDTGHWVDYEVNVPASGVYSLNLRTANWRTGKAKIMTPEGRDLTEPISIVPTGAYQNWATTRAAISLTAGTQTLRIYSVESGWNLNWFELVPPAAGAIRKEAENYSQMFGVGVEPTTDFGLGNNVGWIDQGHWMDYTVNVPVSGVYTLNLRTANWYLGQVKVKTPQGQDLTGSIPLVWTGGYQNWATTQSSITLNAGAQTLRFYSVESGWNLNWFELIPPPATGIKIQAEDFTQMYGVEVEPTQDEGGGSDVIRIDQGRWMNYEVNVPTTGLYTLNIRAANWQSGKVIVMTPQGTDGPFLTQAITLAPTGGYQNWATTQSSITLSAGTQTLKIYSAGGGWNFNWFELVKR